MPIDTSIYNNVKTFEAPDVMGSMEKAMGLRQLGNQIAREDEAAKAAEQSRLTKASIPEFRRLMDMPEEKRAAAYGESMKGLAGNGMPTKNLITDRDGNYVYDPQLWQMQVRGISSTPEWMAYEKQRLDNEKTNAEIASLSTKADPEAVRLGHLKTKAEIAELYSKVGKAGREANSQEAIFKALPVENQEQIKDLARKSGNKKAIKNQIDASLTILDNPNVSEEQKVVAGRTLLKTLNSSEGADAIGAEEAKRLGGLLEFKNFNFTEPGSVFGRDVGDFVDQVKLQSGALGQGVERNNAQVDELYGRAPRKINEIAIPSRDQKTGANIIQSAAAAPVKRTQLSAEDSEAMFWAEKNPNDPRAKEIMKLHGWAK